MPKNYQYHDGAQEGASFITKQGAVKKKKDLFQHQGHANQMDSEYLENYVWIYAHTSDLDQGVVVPLTKLCLEWNMVTLSVFLVLQFDIFWY